MSAPGSVLDAQVQMLMKVVDEHRDSRRRELLDNARRDAVAIVGRAHRECRERMRAAVTQERERMANTLAAARAQLASRMREHRQLVDRRRLDQGWQQLGAALDERWRDAVTRRRWLDMIVVEALTFLPREAWRIEHPRDWDSGEIATHADRIAAHAGAAPVLVADDRITTGIRVVAGNACLDGTREALLGDRSGIEAGLLALLRVKRSGDPHP